MDRDYFTCTCGGDRFMTARRIFFLTLNDGTIQRNWATDATDSTHLVCDVCSLRWVWNSKLHTYEPVPNAPPSPPFVVPPSLKEQ